MKNILILLKHSAYKDFINKNKKYEYQKKWLNESATVYMLQVKLKR